MLVLLQWKVMATVMTYPAWGRAMLGEPLTLVEMLWLPLLEAGRAHTPVWFSIGFGCAAHTGVRQPGQCSGLGQLSSEWKLHFHMGCENKGVSHATASSSPEHIS